MEEQIKRIKLFPKQFDAFNFKTQFGAIIAGVQSGKTFTGAYWAGNKITQFPDKNGLIVAPTYKILQHSTLDKFFSVWPQLRKYYKEQKGIIELPTSGKVFIRSADQPLGIEGMTIHWGWGDEAGMMARLMWTVIRSRVSLTGGQFLITTTPYNLGWLYQDFYIPWKEGRDKDLSVFTWRSIDNPFFPKEFAEKERGRLRVEEYARRYEGEFRKMEGLVYDLPAEQIIPFDRHIISKAEFKGVGIDWGFRNPAAIVIGALYDNAWYIVDEWKETEKTTKEIIAVLEDKWKEFRLKRVYPDPAEPDRIKEMEEAGFKNRIGETHKDIKGGISHIQQLIKEKRLFVFDTCHNFLDEMSSYHYSEGQEGKPFKDEPEKFNDHAMDAMRYLIFSYKPTGEIDLRQKEGLPIQPYYPSLGL
jgi:PBSX family phage terminase large subunit